MNLETAVIFLVTLTAVWVLKRKLLGKKGGCKNSGGCACSCSSGARDESVIGPRSRGPKDVEGDSKEVRVETLKP